MKNGLDKSGYQYVVCMIEKEGEREGKERMKRSRTKKREIELF